MSSQKFFPAEVFAEAGTWTNPNNVKAEDGAVAEIKTGATSATLKLSKFGIGAVVPEGAVITKVEVGWRYKVSSVEGNAIVGIAPKVEPSTFIYEGTYKEAQPEPLVLTSYTDNLTAQRAWTRADLLDGTLICRIRVRNNGAAETTYSVDDLYFLVEWEVPKVSVKSGGVFVPALRKTRVGGGLLLKHEDPMTSSNFEAEWGQYQAAEKSRIGFVEAGGSPWTKKGDGSARTNFNYRTLLLKASDVANVGGERCELGHNERRYGTEGGEGTFALYQEHHRYKTFVDLWLPGNFPVQTSWYDVLQLKEAQPYSSKLPNESPIIAIQCRAKTATPEVLEWQIIAQPDRTETNPLWGFPATRERWTRICLDTYHAKSVEDGGFVHVTADDRSAPTSGLFVPQYDSGVIAHATMGYANGPQTGFNWELANGQAIENHLRIGQYRTSSINVETATRLSLAEQYEVSGEGGEWAEA